MHKNVYNDTVHNTCKPEATQLSNNSRLDINSSLYVINTIQQWEWTIYICNNMDKPDGERKKLDPKECICYNFIDKFPKQTKLA